MLHSSAWYYVVVHGSTRQCMFVEYTCWLVKDRMLSLLKLTLFMSISGAFCISLPPQWKEYLKRLIDCAETQR